MPAACANKYCLYGPEWDKGETITRNSDGTVPPHLRGEAYDQDSTRWAEGREMYKGYCLNCIDDARKVAEELEL